MKVIKSFIYIIIILMIAMISGCSNKTDNDNLEKFSQQVVNEETVNKNEYFSNQKSITEKLNAELEKKPTLENPFTIVDPFEISPLTAIVIFTTEEPTQISVIINGKDEYTTIKHTFSNFSKKHIVPIYGLYAGVNNKVDIIAKTKTGEESKKTIELQTDDLPEDISKVKVNVADKEKMKEGLTFFDCPHVNGNYMLAIDSNGDIRWYLSSKKLNGSVMLTHLKNGNMIVSSGETIPNTYNNLSTVFEISPLGECFAAYNVYGIHHDIREKSNGNLIMGASKEGRDSQNDYIVEVDRKTGNIVDSWDLKEILPMSEYVADQPYTGGTSNWLHNNAIWYDENNDDFIISGRHQNVVAKFNAKTKELKWVLSATIGNKNKDFEQYLLKPVGNDFEYPTAQHAAMLLPDNRLMLFDNTNFDILDENRTVDQNKLYSRAVIYNIDENNKTVKQDWQYGKERGKELYSSFVSDVDYLGENHYLIDFGGQYKDDNGTVYDHIYTDAKIKNASNKTTTLIEILNDKVIFEAILYGNSNSNSYKAERKDIYQGI